MNANLIPVAKSVLIVSALASALWVSAGSLTPPPGPITPTMKDLDDVEPRKAIRNDFNTITPIVITESGSYYLAEDIYAIHSQHGIEITASNVTLDLNGFTVYGNLEVGSLDGIKATGSIANVTVRNGVVRDFGGTGVNLVSASDALVERVRVRNNQQRGIGAGSNAVVSHCIALGNGSVGIFTSEAGTISHSTASENTAQGIFTGPGSLVSNCTAAGNGETGITSSSSTVEHCTARRNGTEGIYASSSLVTGCNSLDNDTNGITALGSNVYGNQCSNNDEAGIAVSGGNCRIEANNVFGNDIGVSASSNGSVIIRNSARSNLAGNYLIFGANDVGPIGTAALATSPWANIAN